MMMARSDDWPDRPTEVLISADRTPEYAWADWLTARLVPNGLAVHRVPSGEDALEIVRGSALGLAFLGARWPRRTGLGLLRRIRSRRLIVPQPSERRAAKARRPLKDSIENIGRWPAQL